MTRPRDEQWARGIGVAALVAALIVSMINVGGPADGRARDGGVPLRIDAMTADSSHRLARDITGRIGEHVARGSASSWPALTVQLTAIPSAPSRTILGDVAAAGAPLRWFDSLAVRDLSLSTAATVTPHPATMVNARVRTNGNPVSLVLRDAGGVLDSTRAAALPEGKGTRDTAYYASLRVRAVSVQAPLRAELWRAGQRVASASSTLPMAPTVRRVRLDAQPGWESKFVVTALEESGWSVDGSLTISPKARVQLGTSSTLDTARYSVAVVLDSGVADARALRAFVNSGGGLVMAGDALRDGTLGTLRPARIEDARAPIAGALLTDEPRRGLSAFHLDPAPQAVVLEHEDGEPVLVVARHGVGRVLAVGYRESWRWRMEGRDESADAHRHFWTQLLAAVAFASAPPAADSVTRAGAGDWPGDVAPLADLTARIGHCLLYTSDAADE